MSHETDPRRDDLSFDRAIPVTGAATASGPAVRCTACHRAITASYFSVNGEAVCESCLDLVTAISAPVREPAAIAKALLLGFGAALVGAVVYWAVIRFFNLEIGIVAVLNGWMVGKAMRVGAGGRGGRVLQVFAALLTYLSVGMAYVPLVTPASAPIGLSMLISAFVIPIGVVFASLPGGLISALIIGFGMMQAWQLTGTPTLVVQGPFRVGNAPAA
ncbi:MAG: hypothetical protein K8S21_11490 [Gemmatimonadetes bacterium]|nr:hypothetical protein [Gemmatimonadota bacterium]